MILTELKTYLAERGRATLADMAIHFESDPEALRDMLSQFIRKGRVARVETGACGGCFQCDPNTLEIYQWTGEGAVAAPTIPASACEIARKLS